MSPPTNQINRGYHIGNFLTGKISQAIKIIRQSRKTNPDLPAIIELVRQGGGVATAKQVEDILNLKRNDHDKVFRDAMEDLGDGKRVAVIIPASNAITIVICRDLSEEPSIEELVALLS